MSSSKDEGPIELSDGATLWRVYKEPSVWGHDVWGKLGHFATPADLAAAGYVPASLATAERLRAEKAEGERDAWQTSAHTRAKLMGELRDRFNALRRAGAMLHGQVMLWKGSDEWTPEDAVSVEAWERTQLPSDPTAQGRASEAANESGNVCKVCREPCFGAICLDCAKKRAVEPAEPEQPDLAKCTCGATAEPDYNGGHFGDCPASGSAAGDKGFVVGQRVRVKAHPDFAPAVITRIETGNLNHWVEWPSGAVCNYSGDELTEVPTTAAQGGESGPRLMLAVLTERTDDDPWRAAVHDVLVSIVAELEKRR